MGGNGKKVIVVGGGLAGLSAALKIAESGAQVELFSMVPVRRSHSVCAQGGINAATDPHGQGDSTWEHFDDTIYGGDFLANQTPVKGMCEAAPAIIDLLDRMGVTFNRTSEGRLDVRAFGGAKFKRTAFAGATTGQQLMYALDEQVRRFEAQGLVTKYEFWEFLVPVIDDDRRCRGIVAMSLDGMDVRAFPADAVIMATGGPGLVYGTNTTNSFINTGSAAGACFRHGVDYANGEFIQVHPTAIQGEDKRRLISESVRGEGGRVWVPKDGKPWYFLEEWYPAYGNLVPRDIATRAIFKVVYELDMGIEGRNVVYLDVSHLDPAYLTSKLGGVLEIYEKFVGDDPRKIPMQIFPAVHYSMGGLWVDFGQMTNVAGLFAAGECDYQYHGANRLGANSLLSCIHAGFLAGPEAVKYLSGLQNPTDAVTLLQQAEKRERDANNEWLKKDGTENPYALWREMGNLMTENVTVIRENPKLKLTDEKLLEIKERYENRVGVPDKALWKNQPLVFTRQLENMIALARVVTLGALARNESRGAHYKPEFPDRDDANFLKTTRAAHSPHGPVLTYEEVDIQFIPPRERKYDVEK
jgi:succinate dehydrogenase / fumarate reductase flavoprotein subunit